ncbi:hypothetical protein [Dictyobacter kobayashii]|uniref:Uncharacterized protein n=1 Tax=Dictyobacter kobayashii TaxID=2014872 RepID=A0A402AHJ5_9CHLR|nr:hypothetical protein [Dictyobacter kobayashii]GCE18602.1 hypothetical protein KDK_24020 [Dictyobacter kobayashii]
MSQSVKYILLLVVVFLLGALITVAIIIPDNISSLAVAQGPANTTSTTGTPDAALPPAEQIQQLAQSSNAFANLSGNIDVKYNQGNAQITEKLYKISDIAQGRDQVKHDCFTIQRAIWNANISQLNSVKVLFAAPVSDKYGNITPNENVGSCTLNNATAKKVVWENLSYQRAWDGTGVVSGSTPVASSTPNPFATATPIVVNTATYVYDAHSFVGLLATNPTPTN